MKSIVTPAVATICMLLLCKSAVADETQALPVITLADSVTPEESLPQKPAAPAALEEIVVTAQRRQEPLQDVPVSVTHFGVEQLQDAGALSTQDLGRLTPGLQFTEISGSVSIFLRGVGTDSFILSADPSVATYVDGVYVPAQLGLLLTLGGAESIEVLKGPQGTLFGRNSTAGAIGVTFKAPSAEPELSLLAERRNRDTRFVQVYANAPLSDTLSINLALATFAGDSHLRNSDDPLGLLELPPASGIPGDRARGGRLKLRWAPSENFDLTLGAFRTLMDGTSSTVAEMRDPSALAKLLGIRAGDTDYEIHRNEPVVAKVNHSALSADARWHTSLADLRLIVADQQLLTTDGIIDYDFSRKDIVSFASPNSPTHQQTAELQWLSNDGSPGAEQFDWISGLYYLRAEAGFDPVTAGFFGSGLPVPLLDRLPDGLEQPLRSLLDRLTPGLEAAQYGVLETNSYSAYGQGSWHFTEQWSATLGLRYQKESRFLVKQYTNLVSPLGDGSEITILPFDAPKVWQDNLSKRASLQWKFAPGSLVFASYGRGYKSGTYNLANLFVAPDYVQPERVNSYELGLKSMLLDGSLRLNAALFLNQVNNPQTSFIAVFSSGSIVLENAGKSRSRGAEFEMQALPMPRANPGLALTASVCFVDAIFADYDQASGYDEDSGIFRRHAFDLTGKQVPRAPRLTGNLGIVQRIDAGGGQIELGVDAYYNSGFYYSSQNFDSSKQPAYSLLNARIGYHYQPWRLRLTAFGINLDDETYSYAGVTGDFGTAITLAPPRTYGLRLQWDY